jgi:hypothetical protein
MKRVADNAPIRNNIAVKEQILISAGCALAYLYCRIIIHSFWSSKGGREVRKAAPNVGKKDEDTAAPQIT